MRKAAIISSDRLCYPVDSKMTEGNKDDLPNLVGLANRLAEDSKSSNTKQAYDSDWRDFRSWCGDMEFKPLPAPADTVCLYLANLSKRCKYSTIKRRLAAITHFHKVNGHPPSNEHHAVIEVMAGIRRSLGNKQVGREPILKPDLRAMVEALPANLTGVRDKALLLVGFFSACRRSELVGLDVDDLEFSHQGLVLHLRRTKTDQESLGREVGIPVANDKNLCPVRAMKEWLAATEITEGPVFRAIDRHQNIRGDRLTGRSVALIVKRAAKDAGLDTTKISAHSLRSGFCTEAALNDVEERVIMKQTGHKHERVVRGYIKEASVFQNNGAKAVGF